MVPTGMLHCKESLMGQTTPLHDDTDEVDAAFMRNHRGEVCIAFTDPVYVRADAILVDPQTCSIQAVLHEASHRLGHVSEGMIDAFTQNNEALLTAMRP